MNEFNVLVLNIAIVVFIITLIVVGVILYYSVNNARNPPFTTACPTYFKLDSSGENCVIDDDTYPSTITYPVEASDLDNLRTTCASVPVSKFKGTNKDKILCAKNRWAKSCNVFWDGVTNNNSACFREKSTLFPGK